LEEDRGEIKSVVIPVPFSEYHKEMLATTLRTAVEKDEGTLSKEMIS
jgi:hypothetical protein